MIQQRSHRKLSGRRWLKEIADRVIAMLALFVFSPLVLVIAILLYFQMGQPIIFKQLRPGKDGQIFTFYKFRTMTNQRDCRGHLLPDEKRLTTVGKFLRKTSLDELPQLWNVVEGNMSIVGPRPLLVAYLDRYTPQQFRRHEVKPGITGWAQVNGRNAITWKERFNLDVWYVDHWSLWLDLKIIFLTLLQVIKREGISQKGHATMSEFLGNIDQ